MRHLSSALRRTISPALCVVCLVCAVAVVGTAGAQKGDAALSGRVVDKSTGAPLARADIINTGDSRVVVTDSAGNFSFPDLRTGIVRLMVRASGFPTTTVVIALARGERMIRDLEVDSTKAVA